MAEEGRRKLRNSKAMAQALSADEDAEPLDAPCSDESEEEFVLPNHETSDSDTADEEGVLNIEQEQVDNDGLENQAERASKRQRLVAPAERQRTRGRPRKSVPAAASHLTWHDEEPNRRGRRSSGVPAVDEPYPKNDAEDIRSPLQAFNVLFSSDMMKKILTHTNEQITREITRLRRDDRNIQSYQSTTDQIEINALIGTLYYTAVLKQNTLCTRDMWSEEFGCGIYRAAFSEQRFNFLLFTLRFDDKETRRQRRLTDKLAPVREIWEVFRKNCVANYEPSSNCTIGEQLVSFRGRCPFRIYMKNKPDKYGLKILTLNDAKTFYMISAIPCVGKVTPEGNDSVPTYFVRKLVERGCLADSWRTITMDNWFTSVPLFMLLKEKYQLRAVGTTRKGVTDTFDRKCHNFSVARRTQRWPLKFFYNMLNQASINCCVLFNLVAENVRLTRRNFIKDLAFALIEPHLRRCLQLPALRLTKKYLISQILKIDYPVAIDPTDYSVIREDSRARCGLCKYQSSGRTRMKCNNCLRRICDQHRCGLCIECTCNLGRYS